jgi:tetratricopeptide (TPR) repeat protein
MRLMLLMTAAEALTFSGDITGATELMEGVRPESHPEIFTGWTHQLPLVAGDWQKALLLAELSVARQRLSGSPPMLAYVLEYQGQVLYTTGAIDEARRALEEAASLAFPYRKPAVYGRLAVLEAGCGRLDQARAHATRSDEGAAAGNGWRGMLGFVARGHGALAAAESRADDAGLAYNYAAQTFAQYGFPWEEADTLHLWGRTLLAAGDRVSAVAKFDAALAIYRRPGAGEVWAERVLTDRRQAE